MLKCAILKEIFYQDSNKRNRKNCLMKKIKEEIGKWRMQMRVKSFKADF